MTIQTRLTTQWYQNTPVRWLLSPLSGLFRLVSACRKIAYQQDWLTRQKLPVPVIIVGNISVGGSGKTPFVIALVMALKKAGYHPGVISRGYGGKSPAYPLDVTAETAAVQSGDEPKLIAQRTACPVVVAPRRAEAGRFLLSHYNCDVIVSDDGLQHYALQRDIEIAIVDASRGLGNGYCLPAGPLREPKSRLQQVDFTVWHGPTAANKLTMQLQLDDAVNLQSGKKIALAAWRGQTVHAVAGIGHPQRFFSQLRQHGLNVVEHAFADHHVYLQHDLTFAEAYPILMTEKDAVKCRSFASADSWSVPATALIPEALLTAVRQKLRTYHG